MWGSIAYIGCRDAGMGWGRLGLWGTGAGGARSRRLDKFNFLVFCSEFGPVPTSPTPLSITEEGIPTPQNTESFGTDPRAGGLSRFTFSARRRGREAGTSPKPRARDSDVGETSVRETRKVSPTVTGTGTYTRSTKTVHTHGQSQSVFRRCLSQPPQLPAQSLRLLASCRRRRFLRG